MGAFRKRNPPILKLARVKVTEHLDGRLDVKNFADENKCDYLSHGVRSHLQDMNSVIVHDFKDEGASQEDEGLLSSVDDKRQSNLRGNKIHTG